MRQSKAEAHGTEPDWYCPTQVTAKGGKFFHYRESPDIRLGEEVTMIVPPYRVVNHNGKAKIGLRSRYKTGNKRYYFKTILTTTALPPRPEDRMVSRIKTLLVMS